MLALRQQGQLSSVEAEPLPAAEGPAWQEPELADFFRACGGREPIRIDVGRDGRTIDCRHFEHPFLFVGRSKDCDVQLLHPEISFRHAYLQLIAGELLCFDLDSRTGIRWDNQSKLSEWLRIGESVKVGPFSISATGDEFADRPDSDELLAIHGSFDQPVPDVRLEFLNAHRMSKNVRHCQLQRSVTLVGKSSHCKIRLRGDGVSRMHCSLVLTEAGLWVVDLLGRHGTYVNERRVSYGRLEDGDELRVGAYRLGVRYGHDSEPIQSVGRTEKALMDGRTQRLPKRRKPVPARERSTVRRRRKKADAESADPGNSIARQELREVSSGFSESFVLKLIEQFTSMQRTLFQQSQQQTLMLTQMLGAIHQSQRELIQDDLARVNAITSELHQLQLKLMDESGSSPATEPHSHSNQAAHPAEIDADAVDAEFAPSEQHGASPLSVEFAAADPVPESDELGAYTAEENAGYGDHLSGECDLSPHADSATEITVSAPDHEFDVPTGPDSESPSPEQTVDASGQFEPPDVETADDVETVDPVESDLARAQGPHIAQPSGEPDSSDSNGSPASAAEAEAASGLSAAASDDLSAGQNGQSDADLSDSSPSAPPLPQQPQGRRDKVAVETHAWLAERMAVLESERTSRLQKIMQVLTGSGSR